MKKSLFGLILLAIVAAGMNTSCQSKEEKVEEAKEELNEAQAELNEEYPGFKKDAEDKIDRNQQRIEELRKMIGTGGKPLDEDRQRRIDELQQQNAELRARLVKYEADRGDWETFKREWNHDFEKLGESIENFGKDDKK